MVDELATGGRPRLRVLRLFEAEDATLSVHAETLGEAEPAKATFALLDAFDATPKRLAPLAARAASLVRDQLTRGVVEKAAFALEGSSSHTELAFFIEELKERRESVLARLESDKPTTSATRATLVRSIASAHHLLRNLATLEFPEAHAVWIDLSCVGQGRAERADKGKGQLIGWLARAYATARAGWFDGFAVSDSRAAVTSGSTVAELDSALARGAQRVSLLLSGLFAVDTFGGEPGSHIWQPTSAEPEMVRVDVTSAGSEETDPRARLLSLSRAVSEFEDALASGRTPLPPNPEGLVPAVRSLRFNLPLRATDVFTASVLDFRAQATLELNVSSVSEVISAMLECWCGREVLP